MSPGFLAFALVLVIAQMALPRRWAFLPLIIAGCHLGNTEILGDLTIGRSLILLGLLRAKSGGFLVWDRKSRLDRFFFLFSIAAILSAAGHRSDAFNPWVTRLGLVWNVLGTYIYGRTYINDVGAFKRFAYAVPMVLLPLGLAMTFEQATRKNPYFVLGASLPDSVVRDGKVRAEGPFRHPILAGCAGATSLPLAYLLWRSRKRVRSIAGFSACMAVTLASASSGPLAAVAVTVGAATLWRWREKLYVLRWAAVVFALLFWIVKGRGPWYLMASIDLVGGSTGWHRAKLFDQGFTYLNEWWLCGTDYTRHWMASGVSWSPDHVDVTNYYLHLGVTGGVALAGGLVMILVKAFGMLGQRMATLRASNDPDEIVLWCAGAALAAHAISFVSISYFDQMYILFYLLVGAIPGLVIAPVQESVPADSSSSGPIPPPSSS